MTHVDYSARVQTVHADTNPRYHALISAFEQLTGCPVIVNTSFNVRGEPIVCTPEDAFRCFMGTEIERAGGRELFPQEGRPGRIAAEELRAGVRARLAWMSEHPGTLSERTKWQLMAVLVAATVALLLLAAEGAVRVRQAIRYGTPQTVEDLYVVDAQTKLRAADPRQDHRPDSHQQPRLQGAGARGAEGCRVDQDCLPRRVHDLLCGGFI